MGYEENGKTSTYAHVGERWRGPSAGQGEDREARNGKGFRGIGATGFEPATSSSQS